MTQTNQPPANPQPFILDIYLEGQGWSPTVRTVTVSANLGPGERPTLLLTIRTGVGGDRIHHRKCEGALVDLRTRSFETQTAGMTYVAPGHLPMCAGSRPAR